MAIDEPVWITDNLSIGPALEEEQLKELPSAGVGAVVDMRSEYKDDEGLLASLGIEFLHIGVDDTYSPTFDQIDILWQFVSSQWKSKKKVYIHCQNGYGRSPLAAISVLTKSGWSMPKALYLVEDKHPFVSFSDNQQRFLYELERYTSSGNPEIE